MTKLPKVRSIPYITHDDGNDDDDDDTIIEDITGHPHPLLIGVRNQIRPMDLKSQALPYHTT
jgi:hypothetical protein